MPRTAPSFQFRFRLEFPTERRFLDGAVLEVLKNLEASVAVCGRSGGGAPPPPVDLERVRVALREALANAAEHGNEYRPERVIRVEGWADADAVVLEVEDDGQGFDVDATRAELAAEDVRRDRGRGLAFMAGLADEVRHERGGTRVVLRFDRRRE